VASNDDVAQAAQFVVQKVAEESIKVAEGVASGEISSLKDLEKQVCGDMIDSLSSRASNTLINNGILDATTANDLSEKFSSECREKMEHTIDREGDAIDSNHDMIPCFGACCFLCGIATTCCPTGFNCLLTFMECQCFVCTKKSCCCCDITPSIHCCDGKCGCFQFTMVGCLLDVRVAFPGTSMDKVPCVMNLLGWTCCYRNSFAMYCCKSILHMDKNLASSTADK